MDTLAASAVPVPEQPVYLAYVHRAVYDAVRRTEGRVDGTASSAAVATAAHAVLAAYFPARAAALDSALDSAMAALPDGGQQTSGVAVGRAAARHLLRDRADDGLKGTVIPAPAPGVGVWVPTPPNLIGLSSWLGSMRPFVLGTASQLRPAGPPPLSSAEWAAAYEETRIYGSATSTVRTAEQTLTARFWSDAPYVQNQRGLRAYSTAHGLGTLDTARLFALADTAAADALIACWDAKYQFELWRPFSAIPADDGNPATVTDPTWRPLLATPNHPEYPSAHGCATTALGTVVAGLAPDHRLDLDLDSTTTGATHHFGSVDELVAELGNARVWGGLHWRFSTRDGSRLGAEVGRLVLESQGD